ncbi:MAG: ribosome maturation factor RimP [Elusimicrobiota bacterium]
MSIVSEVEKLAGRSLVELGYELVDVQFQKEHGEFFLRVFIDKMGGVSLDDCSLVSEKVGELLDQTETIPYAYHLEISSPGLNRPLKRIEDFKRFQGQKARVNTFGPIDGQRHFLGEIGTVSETGLELKTEKGLLNIPFSAISKANLEWET